MASYYRRFTDLLPKGFSGVNHSIGHLKQFYVLVRLQILSIQVQQARVEVEKQALYWENVVKSRPDYPDAYYQAAWYSYMLGEKQRAYEFLNHALSLDPSFKKAQELKNKLLK